MSPRAAPSVLISLRRPSQRLLPGAFGGDCEPLSAIKCTASSIRLSNSTEVLNAEIHIADDDDWGEVTDEHEGPGAAACNNGVSERVRYQVDAL